MKEVLHITYLEVITCTFEGRSGTAVWQTKISAQTLPWEYCQSSSAGMLEDDNSALDLDSNQYGLKRRVEGHWKEVSRKEIKLLGYPMCLNMKNMIGVRKVCKNV